MDNAQRGVFFIKKFDIDGILRRFDLWKGEMYLNRLERGIKKIRKKYCHKGFHKLIQQTVTRRENRTRTTQFRFLKCVYCNFMFFASEKEKERYLKKEKPAKDTFSAFFKTLSHSKQVHSKERGRVDKGDASARGK